MNDYKVKSKKYSGGVKALLSDWMIVFLFVVLFALCCFNANFRTTTNIMNPVTREWWMHTHPCFQKYSMDEQSEFFHDMKQIFNYAG